MFTLSYECHVRLNECLIEMQFIQYNEFIHLTINVLGLSLKSF